MNTKRISQLLIITMTLSFFQPVFAADPAFTLETKTAARASSVTANGVNARVSTSFDVPSKYRNAFPRNSVRYVQVPKLTVINGAKAAKKGSPLNLAVLAAIAGAGWVIDELTGQVTYTPSPTEYEPEFHGGYATFTLNGVNYGPFSDPAQACRARIRAGGSGTTYSHYSIFRSELSCYTTGHGLAKIRWHQSSWPQDIIHPLPQPVVISSSQSDPVIWNHIKNLPLHQLNEALNPNGNPLNVPEIAADLAQQYAEIAANNPNLAYDPATNTFTYTDPDTGEEVSTNPNADPDLNPFDIPDDYARENTQTDILTALKEFFQSDYEQEPDAAFNTDPFNPDSGSFIYKPVLDQLGSLPDLPDVILPDFGLSSSSSCQTITFNWWSAAVVFPSPDQCSKLGQFKQIMGWFLYIITWFGVVYIIIGARKVKSV